MISMDVILPKGTKHSHRPRLIFKPTLSLNFELHHQKSSSNIEVQHTASTISRRQISRSRKMSDSIASSDGPCYFLALPPEIRVMIYKLCLNPVACDLDINNQAELIKIRQIIVNELRTLRKQATLVQLSRLIRQEPLSIYVDLIKTGLQLWTAKYEEAVSGYSTPDGGPSPKQLAFEPHGALMWCLIRRRLRQTTNQLQDRLERWQRIEKIWRCKETNQPDSSHQARLTNHLDECEELNAPEHNGSRLEQVNE